METRVLRRKGGFTLIEALISMVILSIVLVGMQATLTQRLSGDLKLQDVRNLAIQLAADRIRTVQLDPVYSNLGVRYAASESGIPGAPGYTRQTSVTRTVAAGNDYTTITVKVTHPRMPTPVTRSIVVAAP
jgi:prepilin-type N-terminal cleavage/methylation domain-containing protein